MAAAVCDCARLIGMTHDNRHTSNNSHNNIIIIDMSNVFFFCLDSLTHTHRRRLLTTNVITAIFTNEFYAVRFRSIDGIVYEMIENQGRRRQIHYLTSRQKKKIFIYSIRCGK